jgi:hypothetical protein
MSALRSVSVLILLITIALTTGQVERSPEAAGASANGPDLCSMASVPSDVQNRLKADFGSWKIQEPENLSDYSRKTWAGRKPLGCPGAAEGLFQSARTRSHAFLLVPRDHPDTAYRFVVFTLKSGQSSYQATSLEQSDTPGASSYFIRKVPASQFFSIESKKKFHLEATECILLIDSAEQEYGTDIYFWANGHFEHEPVDD